MIPVSVDPQNFKRDSEKRSLVEDYIKHCTQEELLEICPDLINDLPVDVTECEEWNNHRHPPYQLAYDVMNDELCEESVRKYLALKLIEFPETIEKLFGHCWMRLFSTLESQGYRPTKHGLVHESEIEGE